MKKKKKLLIVECKWEKNVSAKKLLTASQEKVKSLPLFEKYKIYYAFFAKSFKHDLKDQSVSLFDLKAIEKVLA